MPPKKDDKSSKTQKKPTSSGGGGKAKKKKWSKGKVKDKANNAVTIDKALYDKLVKEVPTYKLITPSVLVDRMRVNGSIARKVIKDLELKGLIKVVSTHNSQLIYTRATKEEAVEEKPVEEKAAKTKAPKAPKKKKAAEEEEEAEA
ncbi:hypothetical protein M427DRAFT_51441 [Gonapodya prolifera JEL478]|uniref:40S ribosomal protein S25 n=1 Tax=Gonapodya prolifera (strain JEL478) TaxID=1344416 RepID=A0A139AWQ8_GONPJ|nr:hypothetical protein M427DRAFT_51441 [Gonapodya prolifera JEL478]|eukprot:KXS21182.1 hypothetical protein M427DRAFT_51441 [Gonapodya prolifera JEL478]